MDIISTIVFYYTTIYCRVVVLNATLNMLATPMWSKRVLGDKIVINGDNIDAIRLYSTIVILNTIDCVDNTID